MTGYLGASTNVDIDQTINIILISDSSMQNLKNNVFDETIDYTEKTYNSQKSINFIFKFVVESDFIDYYTHRVNNLYYKDKVVMDTYNKFMESRK